jgi:DNA-binding NarL/FixJ family response regulator
VTISVFIVDDHAIVRDGLAQVLRGHPEFNLVGTAATGGAAVEQVPRLRPQVVILDISLPDIDGIEVATRLRSSAPDTAIVMLSMHAGADFVIRALEAGARGYVLKESASDAIFDAVQSVAAGQRYLCPRIAASVAEGLGSRRGTGTPDSLSRREHEILRLVADGHTSSAIGAMLKLSQKTVDTYRSRLMQKLNINSVAGLVKFALLHGLTKLD